MRIYTLSQDGATFGETKYYLTTDGKLTTDVSQAGSFKFEQVGENGSAGISTKAFKLKNSSNTYFTNPNKAIGNVIKTQTRTDNYTHDAQIFCLKDGKYAVRATNATSGSWWEKSWWTVSGTGVCCYTYPSDYAAAYIWEMEKSECTDNLFDEEREYAIAINKNITYKYLQSPAYNEDGDNVLRRTTDMTHIFHAKMQPVNGKKNWWCVQDVKSGKYIIPATDATNGTNWTIADEPAEIYFERKSNDTYFLKGENSNYANAYGDDKATEGYRVANYGTGTQFYFHPLATTYTENEDHTFTLSCSTEACTHSEIYIKNGTDYIPATKDADGNISVESLILTDESGYDCEASYIAKAASYTRKVESNSWGSICLPIQFRATGSEGYKLYKLSSTSADYIILEEVTGTVEAGTPLLMKMDAATTEIKVEATDVNPTRQVAGGSETNDNAYSIVGILTGQEFTTDDTDKYIVVGNRLMNASKIAENSTVNKVGSRAFRAYVKHNAPEPSKAAMLRIAIMGEATEVEALKAAERQAMESYSIGGIRSKTEDKGLNIIRKGSKTVKTYNK